MYANVYLAFCMCVYTLYYNNTGQTDTQSAAIAHVPSTTHSSSQAEQHTITHIEDK